MPFKGEGANRATVLLEMRVALLEWQGQNPIASDKWRGLLEKKKQEDADAAGKHGCSGNAGAGSASDAATAGDIAIDEEGEWSLLVDLSKEPAGGRATLSAGAEDAGDGLSSPTRLPAGVCVCVCARVCVCVFVSGLLSVSACPSVRLSVLLSASLSLR